MKRSLAVAIALLPALALAQSSTWTIDPAHSHASFTVRHMVISNVRGDFAKLSGTVRLDEKDVTRSSAEATIETASIDTRIADRDAHLRSADFFDAAHHPAITFKSTKIERAGADRLKIRGDLTIRGVTKPVVLDAVGPTGEVKDPMGNTRRGVSATTTIDRRAFGLTWGKVVEAGPVVGDEVKIEIESELVKQPGEKQAAR